MQTSFVTWLESRDPELFVLLEAEFEKRDNRSPVKRGLIAGAVTAAAFAGYSLFGGGAEKHKEVDKAPTAIVKTVKTVEDRGEPGKYTGIDSEEIFRYACEQQHNGENIFPYYVNGKQEGFIARMSMTKSSTLPLSKKMLTDRYSSFVQQIRAIMKGQSNALRVDSEVTGQGSVKWEYIARGEPNPNADQVGQVEIVLYARQTAEIK